MLPTLRNLLTKVILLLCAAFPTGAYAQTTPVPLSPVESINLAQLEILHSNAREAYNLGLYQIAETAYSNLLERELPEAKATEIRLDWIAALISLNKYEQAHQALQPLLNNPNPRIAIRRALIEFNTGEPTSAGVLARSIDPQSLPNNERPWLYLLRGLLAEQDADFKAASEAFNQARSITEDPTQRLRFEVAIARGRLAAGRVDEDLITNLEEQLKLHQGKKLAFSLTSELALALHQLGRTEQAISILEEQLKLTTAETRTEGDELLFYLGLIAGKQRTRGNLALKQLVSKGSTRELQHKALIVLSQRTETDDEFEQFLNTLIESDTPHPLLDDLLIIRSRIKLEQQQLEAAKADADRLIEQFPGSTRAGDAMRILAAVAFLNNPPQYRLAADYMNRLRDTLPQGKARNHLTALIADCYFLNGDYLNAADLYSQAYQNRNTESSRGRLVYQQVLALLRADQLNQAIDVLDSLGPFSVSQSTRWQAEWNLISAMRSAGQPGLAFERIGKLLSDEQASQAPPSLRFRLMWLEAQLSLSVGRLKDTPQLTRRLMSELESLPKGTLPQDDIALLSSNSLLLEGQALMASGSEEAGIAVFETLREQYPGSEPAISSYVDEARYFASRGKTILAQKRLIQLVDDFPESPFAPSALYEAAVSAELRANERSYKEALNILTRFIESFPEHELIFYARVKQAEIARKLSEFELAQTIYQEVLVKHPRHPQRYVVELALADALFASVAANTERDPAATDQAQIAYERLFDLSDLPPGLRAEAGYKWGNSLKSAGRMEAATNALWQVITELLVEDNSSAQLDSRGRYWSARALLDLGNYLEQLQRIAEARRAYELLLDLNLPGTKLASDRLKALTEPVNTEPRATP